MLGWDGHWRDLLRWAIAAHVDDEDDDEHDEDKDDDAHDRVDDDLLSASEAACVVRRRGRGGRGGRRREGELQRPCCLGHGAGHGREVGLEGCRECCGVALHVERGSRGLRGSVEAAELIVDCRGCAALKKLPPPSTIHGPPDGGWWKVPEITTLQVIEAVTR